ncbi:MAG: hypothetical protein C0620_04140 [Desulfuromonas sp.]|jgi:hypothetical protein|nr:MAG: hypothetical protein C0620_04140 [Desulfuromonas sp.]
MKHHNLAALTLLCCCLLCTMAAAQQLELVAKDPGSWQATPAKGRALITFSPDSGHFELTASHLPAEQDYVLVQHQDRGDGHGYMICTVTTTRQGTIRFNGSWSLWEGKIWLVRAEDVRGAAGDQTLDQLKGWHPRHYLFETRLLTASHTPAVF